MRTALAICAPLALSCSQEATQRELSAPHSVTDCDTYAADAAALGWCRTLVAAYELRDVEQVCGGLSEMADECRTAWVSGRLAPSKGFSTDALLAACAGYNDCAMTVLDLRPAPSAIVQISRCSENTGVYANDCIHHALQRWKLGAPTDAEAAALAALGAGDAALSELIGSYLGEVAGCLGTIACAGDEAVVRVCESVVDQMRREPTRCARAFSAIPQSIGGSAPATPAGGGADKPPPSYVKPPN